MSSNSSSSEKKSSSSSSSSDESSRHVDYNLNIPQNDNQNQLRQSDKQKRSGKVSGYFDLKKSGVTDLTRSVVKEIKGFGENLKNTFIPSNQWTTINDVTNDVVLNIMSYMDTTTLRSLSCCAKRYNELAKHSELGVIWEQSLIYENQQLTQWDEVFYQARREDWGNSNDPNYDPNLYPIITWEFPQPYRTTYLAAKRKEAVGQKKQSFQRYEDNKRLLFSNYMQVAGLLFDWVFFVAMIAFFILLPLRLDGVIDISYYFVFLPLWFANCVVIAFTALCERFFIQFKRNIIHNLFFPLSNEESHDSEPVVVSFMSIFATPQKGFARVYVWFVLVMSLLIWIMIPVTIEEGTSIAGIFVPFLVLTCISANTSWCVSCCVDHEYYSTPTDYPYEVRETFELSETLLFSSNATMQCCLSCFGIILIGAISAGFSLFFALIPLFCLSSYFLCGWMCLCSAWSRDNPCCWFPDDDHSRTGCLNFNSFCTGSAVLAFGILLALRVDGTIDTSYTQIFIPIWILLFFIFIIVIYVHFIFTAVSGSRRLNREFSVLAVPKA